jgi:hypothetical protein
VDAAGNADLSANESTREALWGKPNAFDPSGTVFEQIRALAALRDAEPPLRYGRLYFREISRNGQDFGQSSGPGGIVAFSRILVDREVLVAANTGSQPFAGAVILDRDIHASAHQMTVAFSNLGTRGSGTTRNIANATFYGGGAPSHGPAAVLDVILAPHEVQVIVPA